MKDSPEIIEKRGETDPQKEDLSDVGLGALGSEVDQHLFEETNSVSNEINRHISTERDLLFENMDKNHSLDVASSSVKDIVTGESTGDSAINKVDEDYADLSVKITEDVQEVEMLAKAAGAEEQSSDVQKNETLSPVTETKRLIRKSHEGKQLPQVTGTVQPCLGAYQTEQPAVGMSRWERCGFFSVDYEGYMRIRAKIREEHPKVFEQHGSVVETEMLTSNVPEVELFPKVSRKEELCLGAHKTGEFEVKISDAHIDRRKEADPEKENEVELKVLGSEEDKYLFEITQALSKRVEAELEIKKTKLETLQTEKVSLEKTLEHKLNLFDIHKDNVKSIIDSKAKDMKNVLVLIDKEEDEKNSKVKKITDIDSKLVELDAHMMALKGEKNDLIIGCDKADDQIKKFTKKKGKLENVIGLELEKAKEEGTKIETAIQDLKRKLAENSRSLQDLPNEQINCPELKTTEPNKQLLNFIDRQIREKEKELECPVCLEIAIVPIFMCIESHLICSNCRPKIFECPECRLTYSGKPKRHRYAEKAAEELNGLKCERQELLKHDHSS